MKEFMIEWTAECRGTLYVDAETPEEAKENVMSNIGFVDFIPEELSELNIACITETPVSSQADLTKKTWYDRIYKRR